MTQEHLTLTPQHRIYDMATAASAGFQASGILEIEGGASVAAVQEHEILWKAEGDIVDECRALLLPDIMVANTLRLSRRARPA